MPTAHEYHDDISMPALLRHARAAYASAMRDALADAGYDDIPQNGLYVIGGLAQQSADSSMSQLVADLRITKQAASQLIDTLVVRGYLHREVDEDDRRRLRITLTSRGLAAADVQAAARVKVDAELIARAGPGDVERTRRTLGILIDISREQDAAELQRRSDT